MSIITLLFTSTALRARLLGTRWFLFMFRQQRRRSRRSLAAFLPPLLPSHLGRYVSGGYSSSDTKGPSNSMPPTLRAVSPALCQQLPTGRHQPVNLCPLILRGSCRRAESAHVRVRGAAFKVRLHLQVSVARSFQNKSPTRRLTRGE